MKALSVKQPFAGLIVMKEKIIEVRSWKLPEKYLNQDILICSSATRASVDHVCSSAVINFSFMINYVMTGKALCIARFRNQHVYRPLIDDISTCLNPAYAIEIVNEKTQFAWDIDPLSIRLVKPFPVKGKLGFFDVPDNLIEVVK